MWRRIIDSAWTYFIGAGLLLAIAIASQFELKIPSRPKGTVEDLAALAEREDLNVLFIVIDTLRADRLGIYGYERNTSPVIDDLARHGIVFEHTVAQSSWTKASMASLWTATNPVRNDILRFNQTLPAEVEFPAEILQRAGFRTAGIFRNGWVAPNFGFGQGFGMYVKPVSSPEYQRIRRASISSRSLTGTDFDLTNSAVEFLRNFGSERFFLYMHFMDLHQYVYDDQAPDFGNSYSDVYDKSISWTDRVIGGFLMSVDELGLLTNTLIVIAADHGEAFMEHGFEGHARNLYREVAEVPLIIVPPFVLEEGVRVEPVVANIDIWPTIFDLIGFPPMQGVDGVSQLPQILEAGGAASHPPTDELRRPVFSQLDKRWGNRTAQPDPLVSVTDDSWRVIFRLNQPEKPELYDRQADPLEAQNLAADRSEEVAAYQALVDRYLANDDPPWNTVAGTIELEEMQLNQLRALGYRFEQ
jgi:arylsulfatase A-like enzyme